MGYLADTREIILALKKVYKDDKLSIDKVLAMVDAKEGEGKVSRSTIQRLFAAGLRMIRQVSDMKPRLYLYAIPFLTKIQPTQPL